MTSMEFVCYDTPNTVKAANGEPFTWGNIYAHGELERLFHQDLLGWHNPVAGVHQVQIASLNGIVHKAIAFIWKPVGGGCADLKGLVVLPDDYMGLKCAIEAYESKVSRL